MQNTWILMVVLVGLAALAAQLSVWLARRRSTQSPGVWPVTTRPLTSFGERRTWAWIAQAMPEQRIALKIPLARFTHPGREKDAARWYKRLKSLYCTFTVSSPEGKVLGCVDVENDQWPSPSSQALKRSVLSQLNIPYWVVDPHQFPDVAALRAEFLREPVVDTGVDSRLLDEDAIRRALDAVFVEKRQTRPGALDTFPANRNRRAPHKEHALPARHLGGRGFSGSAAGPASAPAL